MRPFLVLLGMAWILGSFAGFVYCVLVGQYGLALCLPFVALVPVILDR